MGFGADYLNVSAGTNAAYGQRLNNAQAMRNDVTEQDKLDELRATRANEAQQRQILAETPVPQLNKFSRQDGALPSFTPTTGTVGASTGAGGPAYQPRAGTGRSKAAPESTTLRQGPDQSDAETSRLARQTTDSDRLSELRRIQLSRRPTAEEEARLAPQNLAAYRANDTGYTPAKRLEMLRKLNPSTAQTPVGPSSEEAARARGQESVGAHSRSQDFTSRIRQAESAGNPNAVGPYIPGQGTAKGDMQVMDATNTNPGLGVVPARDNSPEERSRVGRDYAQALLNRYGNEADAAAAYNWGLGNFDKWVAAGRNAAQMPAETRNYIAKVAGGQPTAAGTQTAAAPGAAQAPTQMGAAYVPQVNPEFAQRELVDMENHYNMMARMAQTERNPAKAMELRAGLMQLSGAYTEKQLQQMTRTSDLPGMLQMANMFGHKMGAANAGNGMVVLTDNGQPGQPMTAQQAVSYLYQGISPLVQQMNQNLAMKVQEARIKSQGEIAVENVKGQNAQTLAQIHGNYNMAAEAQKALYQQGMNANEFTIHSNANGQTLAMSKDGRTVFEFVPGQTVNGVQLAGAMQRVR